MKTKVLLVEDEPAVLASLRRFLVYEGYQVASAVTGTMALELFREEAPQIVILDIMLPELDGFQVLKAIRQNSSIPVLILTARDGVADRVQGLEAGADDYLVKPYAVEELLARLKALLRRPALAGLPETKLHFQSICMQADLREVKAGGVPVKLTPREWELMLTFLRNPRIVLSREKIFASIWGYDHEGSSNLVDVYVRSLRDKLRAAYPDSADYLQTVWGVGYMLKEA